MPLSPITDVEHGLPFTLICAAQNDPSVTQDLEILWLYNELEIVQDTRVTIMTTPENNSSIATSRLMFSPVFQTDTGNYTCQVHNREVVDAVRSTIELNVTGKHS